MSIEMLKEILREEKKVWQQKSYKELLALIPKRTSDSLGYELNRRGLKSFVEIVLLEVTEEYLRLGMSIHDDTTPKKFLGIFRVGKIPTDGWFVFRDGRVTSSLE